MRVVIDDIEFAPIPKVPEGTGFDVALELRFSSDAGDNLTIREYLLALMLKLWGDPYGFSGKRPFGNGGWEYDIYIPLIAAGLIPGKLDVDGRVDHLDHVLGDAYVTNLILYLFNK